MVNDGVLSVEQGVFRVYCSFIFQVKCDVAEPSWRENKAVSDINERQAPDGGVA